jgi:hypothetical protein
MNNLYEENAEVDRILDYAESKYAAHPALLLGICESVLDEQPGNCRALELLFTRCVAPDTVAAVISVAQKVLPRLPIPEDLLIPLGLSATLRQGEPDYPLLAHLGKVIGLALSTLYGRTGSDLYAQGNYRKAVEAYLKGIEIDGLNTECYGHLHAVLEKYPEAGNSFRTNRAAYRLHNYFSYNEDTFGEQTVYLCEEGIKPPVFSIVSPWGPIANNCRTFPLFYEARNITLRKSTHQFTIFHENSSIIPTSYLPAVSPTPDNPYVAADRSQALFRVSQRSVGVSEPLVVIDSCLQCFAHFMHDYLPYMLLACRQAETKNCRILVPSINANEERFLSHLGIPREKIITWHELSASYGFPEALELTEAYLPIHLPLPVVIEVIRSAFGCPADSYADGNGRRIFISRKFTPNVPRRIENEDELSNALAAIGFETVIPELLSIEEQVRVFSEAGIIVGAAGSGSFSQVWSPRGAAVVLLMSTENYQYALRENIGFEQVSACLGHSYYRLVYRSLLDTREGTPGAAEVLYRSPDGEETALHIAAVPYLCDPQEVVELALCAIRQQSRKIAAN